MESLLTGLLPLYACAGSPCTIRFAPRASSTNRKCRVAHGAPLLLSFAPKESHSIEKAEQFGSCSHLWALVYTQQGTFSCHRVASVIFCGAPLISLVIMHKQGGVELGGSAPCACIVSRAHKRRAPFCPDRLCPHPSA